MTITETIFYLEPTQDAGRALVKRNLDGPVSISESEAFDRYIEHTLPPLREASGDILLLGRSGSFLIGPSDEHWDRARLVRQASLDSFLSFAGHAGYLAGLGHRTAAVRDSRLLPLAEKPPALAATGAKE